MKNLLHILFFSLTTLYGQDAPAILTSYTEDDKGVIILINGDVDFPGSSGTIQKSNVDYWGKKLIDIITEATGNKNDIIYRNGDNGGFELSKTRYDLGYKQGLADRGYIQGKLGKEGKAKIISHSKGCAYAVGYINGLTNNSKIKIDWNILVEPYQGDDWDFNIENSSKNYALLHYGSYASSPINNNNPYTEIHQITTLKEKFKDLDDRIKKIRDIGAERYAQIATKEAANKAGNKAGNKARENYNKEFDSSVPKLISKNDKEKLENKSITTTTTTSLKFSEIYAEETLTELNKIIEQYILITKKVHSIKTFHYELEAAIKAIEANKKPEEVKEAVITAKKG